MGQEAVAQDSLSLISSRLVKGAEHLGSLWRGGTRCGAAWGNICVCNKPNAFCIVKKKWLGLLKELHGGAFPYDLAGYEGFLVLECMDEAMFKASGIKIVKVVPPGRALIRIIRKEENYFQTVLDEAPTEGPDPSEMGPLVRLQEIR